MAAWYVYSAAAGTASGADWANAKTTLAAAITAGATGDTYYIAHDHAETAAATNTLAPKGTPANPDKILVVNRAGSVPPVAADLTTGGSITTTGNFAVSLISDNSTVRGAYVYGLTLNCGTGANSLNLGLAGTTLPHSLKMERCTINMVATGSTGTIGPNAGQSGMGGGKLELVNTTVSFGAAGQSLNLSGISEFRWVNTTSAVNVATLPTTLILNNGGNGNTGCLINISGVDLSALGSGKTIFGNHLRGAIGRLANCKLGASVTVAAAPNSIGQNYDLIGCHSSTIVERNEKYRYQGTLTTETTIVRTGGASDGTTAFSWKVVTTANVQRYEPFETFEGAIWNTATGSSKTLTVSIVTDNVTLTDAEIWLEVEYLGSSATPVSTLIADSNATVLTTAANQTTSTETWTTTGLTTPVKQKLDVTFTPQMVGPVRWKVRVAKASTTVYICPKADLS